LIGIEVVFNVKMKKYIPGFFRFFFVSCDILLISAALLVSYYLINKYYTTLQFNLHTHIPVSIIIWLLSTNVFSLYSEQTVVKKSAVFRSTWRSLIIYCFFFSIYNLVYNENESIVFLLLFYAILIASFLVSRLISQLFENILIAELNNDKKTNVLAIASIGGHWVQLLRLMPLFSISTNDVTFISTWDNVDKMVDGHKYFAVPDANRHNKFNLLRCGLAIFSIIFSSRPQIIITTGAAPGLFGVLAGRLLGIKTVWIDSIANVEKLSLSGNIALKLADRVYTQWEHLSNRKVIFAGNILEE
jgi:hypothetical protein